MAGTKRKDAPFAKTSSKFKSKKVKTTVDKPTKLSIPFRPSNREAETDSDPIIESDTPEHSGEDDGVSWPSDNEDTGGVRLASGQNQHPASEELDTKSTNRKLFKH